MTVPDFRASGVARTAGDESPVVVVGAGLSGIAAALRTADLAPHRRVTLIESRPRPGGLAFSFTRGQLSVDNGQHVFLRCCAAYRWLLERLRVTDRTVLQRRLDITVLRPDGRSARLRRTPGVPAPAHLTAALAAYRLLSPPDRVRAARAALALRRLDPADPALDRRTLGEFLRGHGQSAASIDALWGVLVTATLNLEPDAASLALAARVFRTGLFDRARAGDVGYADAPLGDLHATAALRALHGAGVDVRLAHHVQAIERDGAGGHRVTARHRGATVSERASEVILAVPPRVALRIAPDLERTAVGRAGELGTSPIVNVHLVYDRPVTDLPFAAAVDSPVQWFFDRTSTSGVRTQHPSAQYLAVTVSAADAIIDTPSRQLLATHADALSRLLPRARSAAVLDAFVTRERHATFRQAAGTAALRPGPGTELSGVWLAGAWTATGWPDTMEGAVRSGVRAAEAALRTTGPDALDYASTPTAADRIDPGMFGQEAVAVEESA